MYDVAIIGGGIVGLATAYRLRERRPDASVVVLEKEEEVALHQSGRNSGVIHSGIYYTPGSLKARNCRRGKAALEEFCEEHEIPYETCGKVIVASDEAEVPTLEQILENGRENGVDCTPIGPDRLQEIEPHARGVRAIHVPESGVVDYRRVSLRLADLIEEHGWEVRTGREVTGVVQEPGRVTLETSGGAVEAGWAINCAGLYADRIARMSGLDPDVQIVPFRGEYYALTEDAEHLCRGLIYPVPDPSFPFLGVHFTLQVDGGVECGPNAVLAFAREGYLKTDLDPAELAEALSYPGFLRLAAKYWSTGLSEMWRSFSKRAFVGSLQELVPDVREEHLEWAPAGVRAQALDRNGELVEDFLIEHSGRMVNVLNAPSPAATSSLEIGRQIAEHIDSSIQESAPTASS